MARRPSPRSRTALRSGSVTPEELTRSMEQMHRLLWTFYRDIGASPRQIKAAFTAAALNGGRRPYRMSEAVAFEIFHCAAELIDAWYREAAYVDDVGAPRALPFVGPNSFETLSVRFLPDHAPSDVAAYFADAGLVVRLANGALKPRRRSAVISRLNAATLDRVSILTDGMLGTLLWNYGRRGSDQPRLERQVHVTRLPVELLPEFNAKSKEIGGLLTGQLNAWLAARLGTAARDQPTARVGVSLLAYVEETEPQAPARTRAAHRRPVARRKGH
jgi:hypothetical protein